MNNSVINNIIAIFQNIILYLCATSRLKASYVENLDAYPLRTTDEDAEGKLMVDCDRSPP